MYYTKLLSLIICALMLFVFQTLRLHAQNTKHPDSKTNPSQKAEKSIQDNSGLVLLAAEKSVYPDNKPRFAFPERDLEIAADVTKALYTDPVLSKYDINFKIKNSYVYLFGKVDLDGVREYAQQVASKVTGVQGVQNDIEYYPNDQQDKHSQDMSLLENIYDRFNSSPAVKIENIHISVYNQTVLLSGVVSSHYERDIAESEAIEAGAREVYNLLKVGEGPDTHEIKNPGDFVSWPY